MFEKNSFPRVHQSCSQVFRHLPFKIGKGIQKLKPHFSNTKRTRPLRFKDILWQLISRVLVEIRKFLQIFSYFQTD